MAGRRTIPECSVSLCSLTLPPFPTHTVMNNVMYSANISEACVVVCVCVHAYVRV